MINHLRELFKNDDSAIVLFFYCNYYVQHDVLQLIETLLKQVALRRLMTSDSIKSLEGVKTEGRRPSLNMLMTILLTEIKTYSRAFIVVDALDESPEKSREDLLAKLRSLTTSSSAKPTSRDIPAIQRNIYADAKIPTVKLPIVASEGDIKSHIVARISNNSTLERLITQSTSREGAVIENFIEKARGMYELIHVPCSLF
jgi:hypothetical protein